MNDKETINTVLDVLALALGGPSTKPGDNPYGGFEPSARLEGFPDKLASSGVSIPEARRRAAAAKEAVANMDIVKIAQIADAVGEGLSTITGLLGKVVGL